jgi:CHASE3 domain sensor protein
MNIGFFIVGGIIFSVYIGLTLWNIVDSSKKSKQENYPDKK